MIKWLVDNAAALAVLVSVITGTWFLASKMTTAEIKVDNLRQTVERISGVERTVEQFGTTVATVEATVGTLGGTVDTVQGTVGDVISTVEEIVDAIEVLDQGLGENSTTIRALARCVVDLHGPWVPPSGVDAAPRRQQLFGEDFLLPASCDEVTELASRR